MNICPLCKIQNSKLIFKDKKRDYFICSNCELIFVLEESLLSSNEEKEIYNLHENDPNDSRYHDFMNRLLIPFREYIKGDGLDFGCGPGPVVSTMLKDESVNIFEYDPIFKKAPELLNREYDFIIATEVIEHIYNLKEDFEKILSLLAPLGALGLMTSFYPDDMNNFKGWGYKNDPTHVRFFSEKTFHWIADKYNLDIFIPRKNVIILKRKE
jgi:transcription initiation factor TFIIIB Brf1 subunit/transcription initiation factor TFIIB